MYVYRGKLNWSQFAVNDTLTIIFPGAFGHGEQVYAYWQWTKVVSGAKKVNECAEGTINSITTVGNEHQIGFFYHRYYRFNAVLSANAERITVTMVENPNPTKMSSPTTLQLSYSEPSVLPQTSRCLVYTGKLNFLHYAVDEMITVVVPSSLDQGEHICAYWQWTVDTKGTEKQNCDSVGFIDSSTKAGKITFHADKYYSFDGEVAKTGDKMTLTMKDLNDRSKPIHLELSSSNFSKKQALIIRYGVGIDCGIFDVRDMLTTTLGFDSRNVVMLYYDIESEVGPRYCLHGQEAPTADRFMEKFTALIKSAKPGDVRFLYVDAYGVLDTSREHGFKEGWNLAERDDGQQPEVVSDGWITKTVRQHLKEKVNLTILCSSCLGGGMLDIHNRTPGIILAACHATQINVKAYRGKDPWIAAVVQIINKRKKRGKTMPSYLMLFNEARLYVRSLIDSEQLSIGYLGPSPDPEKPIPCKPEEELISHQDPQAIFNGSYINPETAIFLEPFNAFSEASCISGPIRYPDTEL
ncbi:hypothetical protein BDD12DRAFT_912923 [Trichophaea hybrida]|nr:hypothetical protein BDD12DRAFT_912923 [Trichophaea hybrida]